MKFKCNLYYFIHFILNKFYFVSLLKIHFRIMNFLHPMQNSLNPPCFSNSFYLSSIKFGIHSYVYFKNKAFLGGK